MTSRMKGRSIPPTDYQAAVERLVAIACREARWFLREPNPNFEGLHCLAKAAAVEASVTLRTRAIPGAKGERRGIMLLKGVYLRTHGPMAWAHHFPLEETSGCADPTPENILRLLGSLLGVVHQCVVDLERGDDWNWGDLDGAAEDNPRWHPTTMRKRIDRLRLSAEAKATVAEVIEPEDSTT
jgi:hypothetical protein